MALVKSRRHSGSSRKQLDREHTKTQRLRKMVFVEYEYEK